MINKEELIEKTRSPYLSGYTQQADAERCANITMTLFAEALSQSPIHKEIDEEDIKKLKRVRNYFGEHDVTPFEHFAYSFLDRIIKQLQHLQSFPAGEFSEDDMIKFAETYKEYIFCATTAQALTEYRKQKEGGR